MEEKYKLGHLENYPEFDFNKYFKENKERIKGATLFRLLIEDRLALYGHKVFQWLTLYGKEEVDFTELDVVGSLRIIKTFYTVKEAYNKVIKNDILFNDRIYHTIKEDPEFWNKKYFYKMLHNNPDYITRYSDAVFYAELDLYVTLLKYFGYYNLSKEIFKGDDNA